MSAALDRQLYLRLLLESLLHGEPEIQGDWRHRLTVPGFLVTDARSLYDHMHKTGSVPTERQTLIDLLIAKDLVEAGAVKPGDRAGRHPRRGLASRGAAAAAIIADAVLGIVGVVGVARPVAVADLGIVLRALVDVLDLERDRGPGRHLPAGIVGEDAGQYAHLVWFLALGREPGLARPALVEEDLDVGCDERPRHMFA